MAKNFSWRVRLNRWIERNGIMARWLAFQARINESTLSRLRSGAQQPTKRQMASIERATKGGVAADVGM